MGLPRPPGGKFATGAATLSPQAWPPVVPGTGQGGQHFPSQPGVSPPGADTPAVWTSLPSPIHAILSGKSLALGYLQHVLHRPAHSRGPLIATPGSALRPFLWLCSRSPPLCTPSLHTRRGRSHFLIARLEASGSQHRCQGPTGPVPSLSLTASLLSHPVFGKFPGPSQER